MKAREIILDFTSLLDVIMIMLFFFVLYSTIDTKNAINDAKLAEQNYNNLIEEQREINEQAARELARAEMADKNAAANQEALNAFEKGEFFQLDLDVIDNSDNWTLTISYGDKELDTIKSSQANDLKDLIESQISKSGFSKDDTFICQLYYDGNQNGTAKVFKVINEAIDSIHREYTCLYFNPQNKSK
ncbi:hypothetical protein [Ruminococcus flavefaciens]|uniref:hypothetical protein n=1 Tax=Ruminococcus flavefaciens TaxID=1265 RepID=UPI0013DCC106|nr:hypothetical protein [Ruminococcus flavefaciens]